ncbi:ABC transporter permease [Okeania sp. SIO3B5]|uniref:ABC transporter permease n=1 Tax=Okeania sp. SIO3B5 TaxID=2607811 RepID=UPI0025DB3C78|nr:iron export ABC transporter permease subunit FetB [Okeania sp. SIO3B5]
MELAALLLLINLILSVVWQLGLSQNILIGAIRLIAQLLLVGYFLQWLFTIHNLGLVLLVALFMLSLASYTAVKRTNRRFGGIYWNSFLSLLVSASFATGLTISGVLHITPWYDPKYSIPLLGMILSNAISTTSLGLDSLLENMVRRSEEVEMLLTLGATRWEAAHEIVKEAIRTGTIPVINYMMVIGLVNFPGIMTGQLMIGMLPIDVVRFQITIAFAIAAGSILATIGVVMLTFRSLFTPDHRLQLQRLRKVKNEPKLSQLFPLQQILNIVKVLGQKIGKADGGISN